MFSGIVAAVGRITQLTPREAGFRLTVEPGSLDMSDVALGDSIAHAGVCLTVVDKGDGWYCVDVSPETLSCTEGLAQPAECFSDGQSHCAIVRSCRLKGVLNEALQAALAEPNLQRKLREFGSEAAYLDAAAFRNFIGSEYEDVRRAAAALGLGS